MFEYDYDAMKAAEKLDQYNFKDILSDCYDNDMRNPERIRNIIEFRYKELIYDLDNLTNDEFIEYLEARYPVRFEEVVTYRMWYRK